MIDKVQTGIRLISILQKIRTQHRSLKSMSNLNLSPLPSIPWYWVLYLFALESTVKNLGPNTSFINIFKSPKNLLINEKFQFFSKKKDMKFK